MMTSLNDCPSTSARDIEDLALDFANDTLDRKFNLFQINNFRKDLLSWYQQNRRKLPWRGDSIAFPDIKDENFKIHFPITTYGVWVSEVMLQQTKVETVIPYWLKWMKRFPDVYCLSKATSEEVNSQWAGLGYYRRAQMLLKGAQTVVSQFSGVIPSDVNELLTLPGIGKYTAGAIASIAHNRVEGIVDGNIIRVYSRLFALKYVSNSKEMEKFCWETSNSIVDEESPGDFNQALMELGATICKPSNPDCDSCPVQQYCIATKITKSIKLDDIPKDVTWFPVRAIKNAPKEFTFEVIVLYCDIDLKSRKYLLVQRPSKGLLANQWEFPNVNREIGIHNDESIVSFVLSSGNLIQNNGKRIQESDIIYPLHVIEDPIVHVFSHQIHTMHLRIAKLKIIPHESQPIPINNGLCFRWMHEDDMLSMGITSGCKKILNRVKVQLDNETPNIDRSRGKRIKVE